MSKSEFTQNTIALIYDFDNTLTPLAMQEYTVLPELGIDADEFWKEVAEETEKRNADRMLTWMRLMIEKIEKKEKHIGRPALTELAKKIEYFQGVEEWFEQINSYVADKAPEYIKIEHYLISAGLKEIIEGSKLVPHFKQIYASEYHYNHWGRATFPSVLVNDTMKTQFLFRINKGRENLSDSINEHMPEDERPVPFSNMIYVGDGLSDVPSMTVTKKNGGFAIAVYEPDDNKTIEVCKELLAADRVDFFAPADYRAGKEFDRFVKGLLDMMIANIMLQKDIWDSKNS